MYEYERTYRTGRVVASVLEIVGWIVVAIGVTIALGGLESGVSFSGNSTPFILVITAMMPGVLIAGSGLFFILQCQHTKSTIDNAEMTREMLGLAKAGRFDPSGDSGPKIKGPPTPSNIYRKKAQSLKFDQYGIANYRGKIIRREKDRFYVGESSHESIEAAIGFIDMREGG